MNDNSSVYNHYFSVLKVFLSITVRNIVIYLINQDIVYDFRSQLQTGSRSEVLYE